jgi:predicted nucleotide-binding protein
MNANETKAREFSYDINSDPLWAIWYSSFESFKQRVRNKINATTTVSFVNAVFSQVASRFLAEQKGNIARVTEATAYSLWQKINELTALGAEIKTQFEFAPEKSIIVAENLKSIISKMDGAVRDAHAQETAKSAGISSTAIGRITEIGLRYAIQFADCVLKEYTNEFLRWFEEQKSIVRGNNMLNSSVSNSKVFIVHGHEDAAKLEVARFLEKQGIVPIILNEQANRGQTLIEKIESNADVGFAVILYTPCDSIRAEDGKVVAARARQNVVFEHGYFLAKIGRDRVCALVKGSVETPSDISGIVYTSMDKAWKLELANELKCAGYAIDMNKDSM